MNETDLTLDLLGHLIRRMQAEQRTLLAEVRTYRRDIARIETNMVTRDTIEAERDALTARLENIETEMAHGFSSILARIGKSAS